MVAANQSSFSGGEMAPSFWGRSDLERYRVGARSIENMVVTQLGSLKRRPGLKFVRELEEKSRVFIPTTGGLTRPYYFNSQGVFAEWNQFQEVMMEGRVETVECPRFWPWPDGQARSIRNAQVFQNGDIVSFVSPGTHVCEFLHDGENSTIRLRPGIARHLSYAGFPQFWSIFKAKKLTVVVDGILSPGDEEEPENKKHFYKDKTNYRLTGGLQYVLSVCPEEELHPKLPWTYKISFVYNDPIRGDYEPVGAPQFEFDGEFPVYVDHFGINTVVLFQSSPQFGEPVALRVYRGRDGVFGFVGETKLVGKRFIVDKNSPPQNGEESWAEIDLSTGDVVEYHPKDIWFDAVPSENPFEDGSFKVKYVSDDTNVSTMVVYDDGSTPDMSEQPPTPLEDNVDLFVEKDSYPNTMCFFEQRAVFGGTSSKPRHLYFSRTGKPYEFTKNADFAPLNSDAMSFQLASTEHEEIQSLVQFHGRLIVLTDKNLWAMGGADGALTPSNATAVCYGGIGASRLQPLVLRNTCLFVSASGNQIFEIRADQNGTQWATRELGTFARHLLDGHSIVSWSYQAVPDPIVWMVREDGVLLSMTYSFETNICAWAHHKTNAFVHSVACYEEKVYVTCERNGVNQLEVMDFFADTRFLDGEREVASPEEAASFGLLGWKDVQPVSSLPGQASEVPLPSLALSGACIAGDAVEAQVQLLDAISYQDLGLRPKTLKKISVDCITSSALKLSEAVGAHSGNETLSESCSRKIVASNVTHSYGFEALGVIESEQPVPLVVLGVSREVDFGDIPMQGGSGEDRPR